MNEEQKLLLDFTKSLLGVCQNYLDYKSDKNEEMPPSMATAIEKIILASSTLLDGISKPTP